LILETIFKVLLDLYPLNKKLKEVERFYPELTNSFVGWFVRYSNYDEDEKEKQMYATKSIYDFRNEQDFKNAILMYISLMSDQYALRMFNHVVEF
jgi:dGTPase